MKLDDYEKYYQKGGSYVIPVEIFNELFNDYECFKNDYQKYKEVLDKAIEYIEENKLNTNKISEMLCGSEVMTLLEILKGDKE